MKTLLGVLLVMAVVLLIAGLWLLYFWFIARDYFTAWAKQSGFTVRSFSWLAFERRSVWPRAFADNRLTWRVVLETSAGEQRRALVRLGTPFFGIALFRAFWPMSRQLEETKDVEIHWL